MSISTVSLLQLILMSFSWILGCNVNWLAYWCDMGGGMPDSMNDFTSVLDAKIVPLEHKKPSWIISLLVSSIKYVQIECLSASINKFNWSGELWWLIKMSSIEIWPLLESCSEWFSLCCTRCVFKFTNSERSSLIPNSELMDFLTKAISFYSFLGSSLRGPAASLSQGRATDARTGLSF